MKIIYILAIYFLFFLKPCAAQPFEFDICKKESVRFSCVVDGDTFWYWGEKMRFRDFDAPERLGKFVCQRERDLAQRAARRLVDLLNSGVLRIQRHGKEQARLKPKRTLVTVRVRHELVSDVMVREGLVIPFRKGRSRRYWCR